MRTLSKVLAHPAPLLSPRGLSWSRWPERLRERRFLPRPHRLEVELLEERSLLAPVLLDPSLDVRTVVSGLVTPTTMLFLGDNDFLVMEKNSGNVKHVVDGAVQDTVLSLPVNFNSERGLLGSALDPNFANNHNVYLYWTESMSGTVTGDQNDVPLLGNRVDRFIWNGSTLTFDRNLITLHSWQPPNPPFEVSGFGNHNGGILKFGP